MAANSLQEESEHGLSTVVRVNADAGDEARVTIDKAMSDEFPSDETYKNVSS